MINVIKMSTKPNGKYSSYKKCKLCMPKKKKKSDFIKYSLLRVFSGAVWPLWFSTSFFDNNNNKGFQFYVIKNVRMTLFF